MLLLLLILRVLLLLWCCCLVVGVGFIYCFQLAVFEICNKLSRNSMHEIPKNFLTEKEMFQIFLFYGTLKLQLIGSDKTKPAKITKKAKMGFDDHYVGGPWSSKLVSQNTN